MGATPRKGALLRFTLRDGSVGYADCHPWPELGDVPLGEQLEAWRARRFTAILDQSTLLAFVDAEARRGERSLFTGLNVPPSHLSIPDAASEEPDQLDLKLHEAKLKGFTVVKVKATDDPDADWPWLTHIGGLCQEFGVRARIDFNARLDFESVVNLVDRLRSGTGGLSWIDWLEDPAPFNDEVWRSIRARTGCRLALDLALRMPDASARRAAEVVVYKSAVNAALDYTFLVKNTGLRVCYTSYLDHPVGQAFAAYAAAANIVEAETVETCGLLTHDVYEPNAFSERLRTNGPVLIPPEGTGIGFDDLLENLPWEELK
ncbi:MAG TPA: enolase C-terminal domain-like protein [Fimbriimonadaceae bacterium]|nr:enolase C-terminal domain-like protein [Fimbriimonadaceae bacterium]